MSLARALVEKHEGRRKVVYNDHLGNATIGVGRNLVGKGLIDSEVDLLLTNDLIECFDDLSTFHWFTSATEEQQAAFISWRFQLGAAGIRKFKNTLAYLDKKDYIQAAKEMLNSRWAKQTPRRAHEITQLLIITQ
tara:strand:- start:179 stop:583 length:405 start_codon:yes stop_codon:yes gene_type:complete